MSAFRTNLLRSTLSRRLATSAPRRSYASHGGPEYPTPKAEGFKGVPIAIGIVAVVVPGGLYLLNSKQEHIPHNDHEGQKGIHTKLTAVEKSKKAGVGGKLHGIDDVVTTKPEDVDHHLPVDALNHPVNREKLEATMRMKPPSKRVDPIKSVRD
ncbi:hypothetical protein N0V93_003972 [Gnomoniopsis smithogilvyi]|uniref:Uncharacterized protein n=1 Tax=Gnomoniopsis smithogilvyi TaxID=1191159 RepID=A0A9W9D0J0_9PEZI|nr:hypothetical protein N0V93_003972 [Gnomoniopsis smithogilvyi]